MTFDIFHVIKAMAPEDAQEISNTVNQMICMDMPIESKAELDAKTSALFKKYEEAMPLEEKAHAAEKK